MYKLGFILLIVASLVGCDLFDDDSSRGLGSEDWLLTFYINGDIYGVIPGTSYELSFNEAENTVSGTIDCNSYISSYSTGHKAPTIGADPDLVIDYIAPTEVLCPYETSASDIELERYNDQKSLVMLALSTTEYYALGATELRVYSVGGQVLIFEPSNDG